MRVAIVAIALLSVCPIAAEANAQQTPPQSNGSVRNGQPLVRPSFVRSSSMRAMDQFHSEERIRRRVEAEEARRAPERRARAERLAALANSGQCDEAVRIARGEGDTDMATRLVEACSRSD